MGRSGLERLRRWALVALIFAVAYALGYMNGSS
jgi:hypothetical protein